MNLCDGAMLKSPIMTIWSVFISWRSFFKLVGSGCAYPGPPRAYRESLFGTVG